MTAAHFLKTRPTDDSIIRALCDERTKTVASITAEVGSKGYRGSIEEDRRQINHHGRKMLRLADRGVINSEMTDEQIVQMLLPSGLFAWFVAQLFQQVAKQLLLWIVGRIREKIWT